MDELDRGLAIFKMDGSEPDINIFGSKKTNSSRDVQPSASNEEPAQNQGSHRERLKYDPDSLYYDMSGGKFLLIFNHYKYKNTRYFGYKTPATRSGTFQDLEALRKVFNNLGFKIFTYTDIDHDKIIQIVSNISKQDHSGTSCLAVAIMTHGHKGGELYAADRPYFLKDIANMFEGGHPSLANKPKLFFIQACRGESVDPGKTIQYDGDEDKSLVVPSHMDFLYAYSTVEDYISWRDSRGTWFMQELCEVLTAHHEEMDLLHMLTLVTRRVALGHNSNVPSDKKFHKMKQNPETRFTLTKLVKL